MASYLKSSAATRTPYRKRVSSAADKWVFLAFFVMGAASIIGLKIAGFHQLMGRGCVSQWQNGMGHTAQRTGFEKRPYFLA